jgi:hypothetical protein
VEFCRKIIVLRIVSRVGRKSLSQV